MSPWAALGVIFAASCVTVPIMLLVRRRAPAGSFFEDTQQAAGVFSVLAFQSYDDARSESEHWVLLLLGGTVVVSYVLLFADRKERLVPQASLMAAITTVVSLSLLMVQFLDHP